MAAGHCIKCNSTETQLFRGDDGHFRKRCDACGYIGGPYVSSQTTEQSSTADQSTENDATTDSAADTVTTSPEPTAEDAAADSSQGKGGQTAMQDWV
jgi:predicted  nucleic acid-binding Zn-ribbon protein